MHFEQISEPHVNPDPVGNGHGFFLSDDRIRQVVCGLVNLFVGSFDKSTGALRGNYHFVAGLEAGDLLFPVAVTLERSDIEYRLLAIPLPNTGLYQSQACWIDLVRQDEPIRDRFERFVLNLLTPFAHEMPPAKTRVITRTDLKTNASFQFAKGTSFRPAQGILWIELHDGFCILDGNEEEMLLAPESAFPLSPQMWFQCLDQVSIACGTTARLLDDPDFETVMA
ncbi:MAG: hypothetical protein WA151_05615, partial [Desulfatirhabdiaceae bacterium]